MWESISLFPHLWKINHPFSFPLFKSPLKKFCPLNDRLKKFVNFSLSGARGCRENSCHFSKNKMKWHIQRPPESWTPNLGNFRLKNFLRTKVVTRVNGQCTFKRMTLKVTQGNFSIKWRCCMISFYFQILLKPRPTFLWTTFVLVFFFGKMEG